MGKLVQSSLTWKPCRAKLTSFDLLVSKAICSGSRHARRSSYEGRRLLSWLHNTSARQRFLIEDTLPVPDWWYFITSDTSDTRTFTFLFGNKNVKLSRKSNRLLAKYDKLAKVKACDEFVWPPSSVYVESFNGHFTSQKLKDHDIFFRNFFESCKCPLQFCGNNFKPNYIWVHPTVLK